MRTEVYLGLFITLSPVLKMIQDMRPARNGNLEFQTFRLIFTLIPTAMELLMTLMGTATQLWRM
ncbi:hypothetical protein ES703_73197 [subsurface metagenome]